MCASQRATLKQTSVKDKGSRIKDLASFGKLSDSLYFQTPGLRAAFGGLELRRFLY